ncbi:hypothetical protein Gotur_020252 [Gossypium turneri]
MKKIPQINRIEDNELSISSQLMNILNASDCHQYSREIAPSNVSIIILFVNYASSKLCLAELSDIMRRKAIQGHFVLPIFFIMLIDIQSYRLIGGYCHVKDFLRSFVVIDDVNDPYLIDCMGVKYFSDGSRIIVTSRDRQRWVNKEKDFLQVCCP